MPVNLSPAAARNSPQDDRRCLFRIESCPRFLGTRARPGPHRRCYRGSCHFMLAHRLLLLASPKCPAKNSCETRHGSKSLITAGDKSRVAGVELASASEPPARRPQVYGRLPPGVDPSYLGL